MDKGETTLEEAENKIYIIIISVIIGMWIAVLLLAYPITIKNAEIQQLKQENEKLTNIIIELNKE